VLSFSAARIKKEFNGIIMRKAKGHHQSDGGSSLLWAEKS